MQRILQHRHGVVLNAVEYYSYYVMAAVCIHILLYVHIFITYIKTNKLLIFSSEAGCLC